MLLLLSSNHDYIFSNWNFLEYVEAPMYIRPYNSSQRVSPLIMWMELLLQEPKPFSTCPVIASSSLAGFRKRCSGVAVGSFLLLQHESAVWQKQDGSVYWWCWDCHTLIPHIATLHRANLDWGLTVDWVWRHFIGFWPQAYMKMLHRLQFTGTICRWWP